jgi:O-antigen ligase/polysaccharide polymerase Wzy-like membrane protein
MTCLQPASTRREYPLRYWSLVAILIGVPNFLKFDTTGLTHNFGLFNISSISSIVLTSGVALVLAIVTVVTRSSLLQRRVEVSAWLWIVLLIDLAASSLLQPSEIAGRQIRPLATDLGLSLYRLGEWTLIFILILSVYTRERVKTATDMIVGLIGMISWVKIILIWAMLPIVPSLVYSAGEVSVGGFARLGGTMVHPVHLAIFSGIAFFYTLMFQRGQLRILGCMIAILTIGLTYARSEQIIFTVALLAYLLAARSPKLKAIGVVGLLGVTASAVFIFDRIIEYLAEGHGKQNIFTLSERTIVWDASLKAFWLRPWIGYGYISGPKHALRAEWDATHWLPPHSHSDFIQALLSGGVLAGILVVGIYFGALWKAFRLAKEGPRQIFLLIVLFQMSVMFFLDVLLTIQYSDLGGVFLLCYIGVTASFRRAEPNRSHSLHQSLVPLLRGARSS